MKNYYIIILLNKVLSAFGNLDTWYFPSTKKNNGFKGLQPILAFANK